ncbi:MAG: Na+/H+ antiporter NhaC family protein, partial [Kiritimatiellia bacterium]
GVCRDMLNTGAVVSHWVVVCRMPLMLIPAVLFIVAGLLSFSTGTSWGTFGILIPIGLSIAAEIDPGMNILVLSSILAGSVLGDHCSPISDTTILSSTGAGCNHINHVATQLPYALLVGIVCVVGYLVAGGLRQIGTGFWAITGITWAVSFTLLIVLLVVLPMVWAGKSKKA